MNLDIANMVLNIGQNNSKDWIDILNALSTPIIAVIGTFIAYYQWQINRSIEAKEIKQYRYENYNKPLKKCQKIFGSKFLTSTNKKKLIIEFFDTFEQEVLEPNISMFDSDDYSLFIESCKNIKQDTQEFKSLDSYNFKELVSIIIKYYKNICILICLIIKYDSKKSNSYLNIFDVLELFIKGIIKFVTPHRLYKKYKRDILPTLIFFKFVCKFIIYLINPFKKKRKFNKKPKNIKYTQLKLFELNDYMQKEGEDDL